VVGTGGDGRPSHFSAPASRDLNRPAKLPITRAMSIEATLERVSAIRQALADPAEMVGREGRLTGGTEAPAEPASEGSSFADTLAQASSTYGSEAPSTAYASPGQTVPAALPGAGGSYPLEGAPPTSGVYPAAAGGDPDGERIVAIAESQIGQAEQPPGSNESPAIAQYRTATAGAESGAPWCAYFASWVARQAGEPIGAGGEGARAVSEVWSWAQSSGRAIANGPGVVPKPGDLIVFGDEHVGIVRGVLPNGQIQTIEGNYENQVSANVRSPTEASGYVEMS